MAEEGGMLDKVKELSGGLDSTTLEGIWSSPVWSKFAFFGRVALYIIICLAIVLIIYKFFIQYKVRCTVWKEIGGGAFEQISDKAKLVTDKQNKKKFQLFKTRWGKKPVTCPVPEAIYKTKSGKRDHYNFVIDDNGQLHPMELDWSGVWSPLLKIRPQERDAWARQEDKLLEDKFRIQSSLEKYLPTAIVLASMLIVIFFFLSKDLAAGMSKVAESVAQVGTMCTIK